MSGDVQESIKAVNDAWNAAFNQGDASTVASLYTADATVLPHTHDVVKGSDSIETFWKSVAEAGFRDHAIEIIDVVASGDIAYEIAKWSATGPGEGESRQSVGGSLANVYQQQADGSWKCSLHIWN